MGGCQSIKPVVEPVKAGEPMPVHSFTPENTIFIGEEYQLKGEWDKSASAMEKEFASMPYYSMFNVKMFRSMMSMMPAPAAFKPYMARTEVKQIKLGGPSYHDQAAEQTCYVQTEKPVEGAVQGKRKCLIYFHGGGCIMNTAEQYRPVASKYACLTGCTIINCNYRLCPETKFPGPVFDCYAIVKHVTQIADELGIDKESIMIGGDSAGSCVVAGAAQVLVERKEADLIKLMVLIHPMIGCHFVNGEISPAHWTSFERNFWTSQFSFYQFMSTDYEAQKEDTFIYPAKMSETVLAQLPKTVVFTGEFDAFRRDATSFAQRLSQADKLADFCVHPGMNHALPMAGGEEPVCQKFWDDISRAINQYA